MGAIGRPGPGDHTTVGIHVCYWVGFAAVLVVPWIVAAWLLYGAIGTVWPLIIGHAFMTLSTSP